MRHLGENFLPNGHNLFAKYEMKNIIFSNKKEKRVSFHSEKLILLNLKKNKYDKKAKAFLPNGDTVYLLNIR